MRTVDRIEIVLIVFAAILIAFVFGYIAWNEYHRAHTSGGMPSTWPNRNSIVLESRRDILTSAARACAEMSA